MTLALAHTKKKYSLDIAMMSAMSPTCHVTGRERAAAAFDAVDTTSC